MKITTIALAVGASLSLSSLAVADWGSHPEDYITVNPEVVDLELAVDSKGDVLIGYADSITSGQDVYLRKLDRNGHPLWDDQAMLLLDRNQTFTIRWKLSLDDEDAVYAGHWSQNHTNSDTGRTERRAFITKTNADGTDGWAEPVMPVPEATEEYEFFSHENMFVSASGQGVAFAGGININTAPGYFRPILGAAFYIGLLNKDGEKVWDKVISEHGGYIGYAGIQMVDDGVVIVYRDDRTADNLSFYVQKYDLEGNPVWGDTPIQIQNSILGIPAAGGLMPNLKDDGNGGVALAWVQGLGQSKQLIHFQHIDADGNTLFPSPMRLSAGNDLTYPNNSTPFLAVDHEGFYVVWSTKGSGRPFSAYYIMAQKVTRTGELAYGTEPVILQTLQSEDNTIDPGSLQSGYVHLHGDQLSVSYLLAEDYTGNASDLHRVDFDTQSNFVRDVQSVEVNQRLLKTTGVGTPFGETILGFTFTDASDQSPLFIQSVNRDGEIGDNTGITLSYPQTPWFIDEDERLQTRLLIDDAASDQHNLTVASDIADAEFEISDVVDGQAELTIIPPADFSGELPFTVTANDTHGSNRTGSMNYVVTVNDVADPPSVVLSTTETTVGEDEEVVITADITDPDSTDLTVNWVQVGGEAVDFDTEADDLVFHTPVLQADTQLSFRLTVADAQSTVTKTVVIDVKADKSPAIAAQSISLVEAESATIVPTITAAESPVTAVWSQASGPALTLTNSNTLELTVTAPYVETTTSATLELTITDAVGETAMQTFDVTVQNAEKSTSGGGAVGIAGLFGLLAFAGVRRRLSRKKVAE